MIYPIGLYWNWPCKSHDMSHCISSIYIHHWSAAPVCLLPKDWPGCDHFRRPPQGLIHYFGDHSMTMREIGTVFIGDSKHRICGPSGRRFLVNSVGWAGVSKPMEIPCFDHFQNSWDIWTWYIPIWIWYIYILLYNIAICYHIRGIFYYYIYILTIAKRLTPSCGACLSAIGLGLPMATVFLSRLHRNSPFHFPVGSSSNFGYHWHFEAEGIWSYAWIYPFLVELNIAMENRQLCLPNGPWNPL